MNIVDPILFQCKLNPSSPAICAPGTAIDSINYGALGRCIQNVGRKALAFGLKPGQTVAIFVSDTIFHAALVLGLTHIGIVTVSARSSRLSKDTRIDAVISDSAGPFENAERIIQVDMTWLRDMDRPSSGIEPTVRGGGEDLCRIILTSGTTGEAKAIALSHNKILGRLARYDYFKGNRLPAVSRLYCELGLSTGPGFQYLIYMLSRGGFLLFFGDGPESTAQAFDLYKIEAMDASPSGLAEWLKFYETAAVFQSSFDHIFSSGGLLPRALSDRVRARLCTNLFCAYGATETGTVAVAPAHFIEDIAGAVGFVTPEAAIEIIDDSGVQLPPDQEGIVRIRTPEMVDRYLGDPEQSKKAFRDGWFYPGDMGYLTAGGILVISGREESVLNLGGDKVRPELVEDVLVSFPGIEQAAVFAKADDLGILKLYAAIVASASVDEKALQEHCEKRLGRGFAPVYFVKVDTLPRNQAGKIERHRLPELTNNMRS